jgi:DeoR/GlpR family transcriptional regulator of sugar metabolism
LSGFVHDLIELCHSCVKGKMTNLLNAPNRREAILERLNARGHVAIRDLANGLAVSEATIRRDLRQLADDNLVELVYGGATARRIADQSLQARSKRNFEAKRTIGHLAGSLVSDGDMLFVDAGTTCYELRHALLRRKRLSVILTSTRLAEDLGANPEIEIIALGGHYRPERMDCVGPLAANAIDQLRGYTAFIGADGISLEFGVSANDIQTAYLYQHLLRHARETILLADHTKFAAPSLFRICGLDSVSRIVTDQPPAPEWQETLAEHGIELITPRGNLDPTNNHHSNNQPANNQPHA